MPAHHSCDSFRKGNLNEHTVCPSTRAAVREKVGLIADVDQLGGYAHLASSQADAPFKNIVDVQVPPDLRDSRARFLIGHHRSARNHAEPRSKGVTRRWRSAGRSRGIG
ncbi:MAG: hypothetical protein JWN63_2659 [Candidatus Acidoferrum typicum]|jgi:hypothetical protein|nr:hypothetical protein [Candidatus Acidoferrum typicum]